MTPDQLFLKARQGGTTETVSAVIDYMLGFRSIGDFPKCFHKELFELREKWDGQKTSFFWGESLVDKLDKLPK